MAIESLGVGSNLDLTSLLSSLKSAEQEKLAPITSKLSSTNAKLSAFGQLQSSLESFQTAAQKLNSPELYEGFATQVSGTALTAKAGSTAAAGSYNIEVKSLATGHSLAAQGQANPSSVIGTGTLKISLGGGEPKDINITDGSLSGIRDAINKADMGVKASIVNDGGDTPYRLVLNSETTGKASEITFPDGSSDGLKDLFSGAKTTVSPADASLKVNGLPITSASNTVEEAIQGVTLNLTETTEGASTKLTVSQDTESVKTAVQDFVKAYNSLSDKINSLTKVDGNGDDVKGAALTGNSIVRSVQSTLRNVMSSAVNGEGMNYLFEAGISFSSDISKRGKLEISDEKKLDDALANNLDGLKGLLAGDGKTGIASRLDTSITQMLTNNGAVASAKAGLESSVKSLEARSERMQDTIDTTVERYKKQFQQLDSLMSKINNTQSYLTQQFEALNGASKN